MKLRTLLVTVIAVAWTLLTPPAFADRLVKADASGDVIKADQTGEVIDPERADGDIIRTTITHGTGNVKIKIAYRELAKVGRGFIFVAVKSNKGRSAYRNFTITTAPNKYYGTVRVENANGKKATCRTTHTVDYAANTALLVIPRRCLGSPRWVRVAVGTVTAQNSLQLAYVDDARGNGTAGENDPFFSTKIFR